MSNQPEVYPVPGEFPGRLFIMPAPSAVHLRSDIQYYRSLGIDTVISMLDIDEAKMLSLDAEAQVCAGLGMDFLNFPIPDFGVPDRGEFRSFAGDLIARLNAGNSVAVHCRAGIGRSGMLVCCVLGASVGSALQAIDTVSLARGVAVPDTPEQRQFIESVVPDMFDEPDHLRR